MKVHALGSYLVIASLLSVYVVTGNTATVIGPNLPLPKSAGNRQGSNIVGPTPNITAVANAITLRSLSLTTQLTVPGGLAVTKPICMTVFYNSYSGSAYLTALYQAYDPTAGNRFVFNDKEGLGTPRQASLKIQLFEPASGGGCGRVLGTGFDLPEMRVNLDPLYDVTVGAIRVTRLTSCPFWMNQDIKARWFSPDNQPREASFRLAPQTTYSISESEWVASEVSASANYHVPSLGFYGFVPAAPAAPSPMNLIPAPLVWGTPTPSQQVRLLLHDISNQCGAMAEYIILRQLKQYSNL
jgi:hypothetical protein